MSSQKRFTTSKTEARELRKIAERTRRQGGIPLRAVREELLADMADELRRMARAYVRTHKGGTELLDALGVAKTQGMRSEVITEVLGIVGGTGRKRKAA